MANRFLFSVVMAAYNTAPYIAAALNSLISQTLPFKENIEIIVINDGSTDNLRDIVKPFVNLYPQNIRYYEKDNEGVSSARNVGLRLATGRFVNFCDSDDYFDHNAFLLVRDFFLEYEGKTYAVAVAPRFFEAEERDDDFACFFEKTKLLCLDYTPSFVHYGVHSSFFERTALKGIVFNEKLSIYEDADFIYRILLKKPFFGVVSDTKYHVRRRLAGNSATQSMDMRKNAVVMIRDYFPPLINLYTDRTAEVPEFFKTMVLRLFSSTFADLAYDFNFTIEERRAMYKNVAAIVGCLSEQMIKNDSYISENAIVLCLVLKRDMQCFLYPVLPEFDAFYKTVAVVPPVGAEGITTALKASVLLNLEIISGDRSDVLSKTDSDYIAFFDNGDRPQMYMLRAMLRRLILCGMPVCRCCYDNKDGVDLKQGTLCGIVPPAIITAAPICLSSFLFKTSYLKSRVADEKIASDNPYFWLSVLQKTELQSVYDTLLTTDFCETRSFEEIYGTQSQNWHHPLVGFYFEYQHLSRTGYFKLTSLVKRIFKKRKKDDQKSKSINNNSGL